MNKQFVQQVAEMRRLQKEYFKTRHPLVLREAKVIENAIDKQLETMVEPQQNPQGKLF